MPGLLGIFAEVPRDTLNANLETMVRSITHEPFFTSGIYVNSDLGVSIGWTCHKNSFSDCMPIYNEDRQVILFFAGEHFGNLEEIEYLKVRGHDVENHLDARYLVHSYEEKGEAFLVDLNGFFHGVILDLRENKVILFNDRYGMQRIYYRETKDGLFFSSEAKAILKVCPETRKIDLKSLGELFSCGCVLDERSLFDNVMLLPGGSSWTFQNGKLFRKTQYFQPTAWEQQEILDPNGFHDKMKGMFLKIMPDYFRSKQPVAFSLTGGLDTRMVLAYSNISPNQLPCYTFGGPHRDPYDVKVSRKIAHVINQPHTTLQFGRDFFPAFPSLLEKVVQITDGCLEASGVMNLYMNRLAREIAPVRITGNYGQEVLRRYTAFRPNPPVRELFEPAFLPYIENASSAYRKATDCHPLSFALFKQAPWFQYPRLCLEQSQLTQRSPYMDNNLVGLVYQAPSQILMTDEISRRLISEGNPQLAEITTDRGISMKSRRIQLSFERAYRQFLFKMDYYYSHGMPNKIAGIEHYFAPPQLEKLFLGHHKYYHLRPWFRDELSEYVRGILLSKKALDRPYINKKFLADMVNGHIQGNRNYAIPISALIGIEILHRLFIDEN